MRLQCTAMRKPATPDSKPELHPSPQTPACADAVVVMISRICGILGGVLISLFLSVLIFPTSASQKATNGLAEGLQALTTLSRMAWGKEGKHSAAAASR